MYLHRLRIAIPIEMLVAEIVSRQLGKAIERHFWSIHITDHLDAMAFLLKPVENTEYAFVRCLVGDFAEYPNTFSLLYGVQIRMSYNIIVCKIFAQKEVFNFGYHTVFVPDFFSGQIYKKMREQHIAARNRV